VRFFTEFFVVLSEFLCFGQQKDDHICCRWTGRSTLTCVTQNVRAGGDAFSCSLWVWYVQFEPLLTTYDTPHLQWALVCNAVVQAWAHDRAGNMWALCVKLHYNWCPSFITGIHYPTYFFLTTVIPGLSIWWTCVWA
jgi:hypothetical protein